MEHLPLKSFQPPPEALPRNHPLYEVPFLGTPTAAVEVILDLAGLKPCEVFCDLGAGDGRMLFAAAKRGATAIGVELRATLVEELRKRVSEQGLEGKVYVTHGDLNKFEYMRQADVVYSFLDEKANKLLKARLEVTLRPGTRVVTLSYKIPGWKPIKKVKVNDPDGKAISTRTVYLYIIGKYSATEGSRQVLSIKNILIIMWKEFLQTKRDRWAIILLLVLPLVTMTILNYSFGEIKNIPTAIIDRDGGHIAQLFIGTIKETDAFKIVLEERNVDDQAARELVLNKTVKLTIILPLGLTQKVDELKQVNITILYDETDYNLAMSIKRGLIEVMQNATETLVREKFFPNLQKPFNYVFDSVYGYPDLKYVSFITPPIIAFTVTFVSIAITSMSIVREKTTRTLERVFLTPIREYEFLLGKLLTSILVTIGEILLILILAFFVFQIPVTGNIPLVFLTGFLLGCGGLGLGLAASATAKKELEAVMVIPAYIIPSLLLSGFFRPIEAIQSPVMRIIARFVPLTYANEALRALMLKNLGIADIMIDILALVTFAIITLTAGIMAFKREMIAQV